MEPQSLQELMRQPLFDNPWIVNKEGQPMGLEKGNRFANWAAKGLNQIKNIWDPEDSDWRPALDLLRVTKSWKTNELRTELLANPGNQVKPHVQGKATGSCTPMRGEQPSFIFQASKNPAQLRTLIIKNKDHYSWSGEDRDHCRYSVFFSTQSGFSSKSKTSSWTLTRHTPYRLTLRSG